MQIKTFVERYVEENQIFKEVISEFDEFFEKTKYSRFQQFLDTFNFETNKNLFGRILLDEAYTYGKKVELVFSSSNSKQTHTYAYEKSKYFEHGLERELTIDLARLKELDYSFKLFLFVSIYIDNKYQYTEKILLCEFPLMVGSNLFEKKKINLKEQINGYFIIKGIERVFISSESLSPNIIYGEIEKLNEKIKTYSLKIMSSIYSINILCILKYDSINKEFYFELNDKHFKSIDPLALIYALGITDISFIKKLLYDEKINPIYTEILFENFEEKQIIDGVKQDISNYISNISGLSGAQLKTVLLSFLKYRVLPHAGIMESDFKNKAIFIIELLKNLLVCISQEQVLDFNKDNLKNKSILTITSLFEMLFESAFTSFFKKLKIQCEKEFFKENKITLPKTLDGMHFQNTVSYSFATGNWVKRFPGVCQLSETTNVFSSISQFKRIVSTLDTAQRYVEARSLNPTQLGRECAVETPDGKSIGLTKNYTIFSRVSVSNNYIPFESFKKIFDVLFISDFENLFDIFTKKYFFVYLNSAFVGFVQNPKKVISKLKQERIKKDSPFRDTNYIFTKKDLKLYSTNGRLLRPLFIVEKGELKITPEKYHEYVSGKVSFEDLLSERYIEYLDNFEEENSRIAYFYFSDFDVKCPTCFEQPPKTIFTYDYFVQTKKEKYTCVCGNVIKLEKAITQEHTHMELTPASIFGYLTNLIPYIEHTASPRALLGSGMIRQATFPNYKDTLKKNESRTFSLLAGQKPIVNTQINKSLGNFAYGTNTIVMIQNYEDYNTLDAIVLNRASIERGYGALYMLKQYKSTLINNLSSSERFELPTSDVNLKISDEYYSTLEKDGFMKINDSVAKNCVLIGKTSETKADQYENMLSKKKDISIRNKVSMPGRVESIILTENSANDIMTKIKLRYYAQPKLGDKFSSRHGQKGVVGKIVSEVDLPYTSEGVSPELLMNPHGLPSRMNYSYLLELFAGKIGSEANHFVDGSVFTNFSRQDCFSYLSFTNRNTDKSIVYSGKTGLKKKQRVNVGVVYYMRLHHLSAEKYFYRSTGPVQVLTRQPTEGKNRGGGLRFGEMERDALLGYGANHLLKERLIYSSDKNQIQVCSKCMHIVPSSKNRAIKKCIFCSSISTINVISVSYAFKLLVYELQSMNIQLKFKIDE